MVECSLVNFFVIPHCQNPDFLPGTKAMMDLLPENKVPVLLLNDNHAVWVDNGKMEPLTK